MSTRLQKSSVQNKYKAFLDSLIKRVLGIVGISLFASQPTFASFEAYPTDANALSFIDTYCKGFVANLKLIMEKPHSPLRNSCLLFAIAAGDQELASDMLDKGANPFSKWNTWVEPEVGAYWPNPDGTLTRIKTSQTSIGEYVSAVLEKAMRQMESEGYIKRPITVGFGFSALTLAIEKNDISTFRALIAKEPTMLSSYADPFGRCPLTYSILLKRKEMIQSFFDQSRGFSCAGDLDSEQKAFIATFGKASILHRSTSGYEEPEAFRPMFAAYMTGDSDLALKILRFQRTHYGIYGSSLFNSVVFENFMKRVGQRGDYGFADALIDQEKDFSQYLVFASAASGDTMFLEILRTKGYDLQGQEKGEENLTDYQKSKAGYLYQKSIDGVFVESFRHLINADRIFNYLSSVINSKYFDANTLIDRASDHYLTGNKVKIFSYFYWRAGKQPTELFEALSQLAKEYQNEITPETRKKLEEAQALAVVNSRSTY